MMLTKATGAFIISTFFPFLFSASTGRDEQGLDNLSSEDTLVRTVTLKSKIFNNERTLRVLLPPHYDAPENQLLRYPVLYLNDGFSVFKNWNLKETVYRLIDSGRIVPIIVVGIDNAINNVNKNPDARTNEYLPYPDELEPTVPHPQGSLYPKFLTEEVLPVINHQFRTITDAKTTGIGGSSYGGYIAFYTFLNKPHTFGIALLESTPFFVSKGQILEDAQKHKDWKGKVAIGLGRHETADSAINQKGKDAQDKLVQFLDKIPKRCQFKVTVTEGEHNAKAWAQRLPEHLLFLYGNNKFR